MEGGSERGGREGRQAGGDHGTSVAPLWELYVKRQQSSTMSSVRARRVASGVLACMCLTGVVVWVSRAGERGRRSVLAEMDPSQAAAKIIAGAEGFHRKEEDFKTDDPVIENSGAEENYAAVASAIVFHARDTLDRLLGKISTPPVPPDFSIPMPESDDDTEKGDQPQASQQSLAAAPPAQPVIETPRWTNVGAITEDNVFAYPDTYIPPDAPEKQLQGRNYWHTQVSFSP